MRVRPAMISALSVAVGLLAAVPPAGGAPGVRKARFMGTVIGTETTVWSEPEHTTGTPNCYHRMTKTGEGREQITFRSQLPEKVLVYSLNPRYAVIQYGSWTLFQQGPNTDGIFTEGSIERSGAIRFHDYPGLCNTGGGPPSDTGPYDCGTIKKQWWMALSPRNRRFLDWGPTREKILGGKHTFRNCPLEYPDGVKQEDVTTFPIRFSVLSLLNSGKRHFVIHGHKAPKTIRTTEFNGTSTSTTTIDVKFMLTRVG